MKQAVVQNLCGVPLPLPEIKKVVPVGNVDSQWLVPYDTAIKYSPHQLRIVYVFDPDVIIQPKTVEEIKQEIKEEVKKEVYVQVKEENKTKVEQAEKKVEKLEKKLRGRPRLRGVKVDRERLQKKKEEEQMEKLNGKDSDD